MAQMAPGPQIAKEEARPAEAAPESPAPEAAQGGEAEQIAVQIRELSGKLKGLVQPDVFANFVQAHVLGEEAAQPTEAPRPVVASFEGGERGRPTV